MSNILKGIYIKETSSDYIVEDRSQDLVLATQQAKNITKQIRYDRTVGEILTNIELLAEKYNIDRDAFELAETEVKNAQRQLEAAIYGLDEIFQEAAKKSTWDSDELSEKTDEGQIYSTGGGAGQSYRKYKAKPAGVSENIVNINDPKRDGWRVYKVKSAGL